MRSVQHLVVGLKVQDMVPLRQPQKRQTLKYHPLCQLAVHQEKILLVMTNLVNYPDQCQVRQCQQMNFLLHLDNHSVYLMMVQVLVDLNEDSWASDYFVIFFHSGANHPGLWQVQMKRKIAMPCPWHRLHCAHQSIKHPKGCSKLCDVRPFLCFAKNKKNG